jgi:hypothetical protein
LLLPGIESRSSGPYSDTILTELPQFLYKSGKRPKNVRKCLHSLLNDVRYLTTAQRISGFTPSRLFTHARYRNATDRGLRVQPVTATHQSNEQKSSKGGRRRNTQLAFNATEAIISRNWRTPNYVLMHVATRLTVHIFHGSYLPIICFPSRNVPVKRIPCPKQRSQQAMYS